MRKSKKSPGVFEGDNHKYATGGAYGAGHGPGRGRSDNGPLYIMVFIGRYTDASQWPRKQARNVCEGAKKRGVQLPGLLIMHYH